MHLPLHATLPDGGHVTVEVASEAQVAHMYCLIAEAAAEGSGYGVDEYPSEEHFREEIRGGHTFAVRYTDSSPLIGAFALANSRFYRGTDIRVADPIVIVRRSDRRRGLGKFLFKTAVQFSKRLGYSGVYTDTFVNNLAMVKIIERSPGFQRVGHLPLGGKMPDGSVVGTYVYFKDLRCSTPIAR